MMVQITDFDQSNKVKIISGSNLARPNQCMVCGAITTEKKYIDLDIVVDDYGYIYICEDCGVNIAQALKCATPDQTIQLVDENNELNLKVEFLSDRINQLEGALDAISVDRLNYRNANSTSSDIPSSSISVSESDQDADRDDSDEGRTDSEPSESTKSSGPNDISNTPSKHDIAALLDL
jgi:hypothetical protein